MSLQSGMILHQRYRLVKQLAQGGFGTLYRAWDLSLGRPCALKENQDTAVDARRQFLYEAKILSNLSHPNLPRVIDYFLIPGQGQYLVMDFIEGQDLQDMLDDRGGALPEERVLVWIGQLCDALTYLHSQNPPVIHRDIKPANIKITPSGEAVLVDFGIAKVYDSRLRTTEGAKAVSPGFSPYEQYGKGKTDQRTDIYALGATLYTLLTGQEPPESVQRVVRDPLVLARQLNPSLSLRTSGAIVRAMQMDPSQRFQNADDFKRALISPPVMHQSLAVAPPAAVAIPVIAAKKSIQWEWLVSISFLFIVIFFLATSLYQKQSQLANMGLPKVSTVSQDAQIKTTIAQETFIVEIPINPTMKSEPSSTPLVYTVQDGDTCSEISAEFDVSIRDIVELNNLSPDCGLLFAGQVLLIPSSGEIIRNETPAFSINEVNATPLVTRTAEADGMVQIYISAGEFGMGALDEDTLAADVEKPQHSVYVGAFWMDQTEISNAMYLRCVESRICNPPAQLGSKTRSSYFDNSQFQKYPVIFVAWSDAEAYCRWVGRRLPSEAEWEKAAKDMDGRIYPWGNELPKRGLANFGNLIGDTQPVKSNSDGASPYGVLNMAGNVSEWVADWYQDGYFLTSPFRNPRGPSDGKYKLLRGGSWFNPVTSMRSTFRLWNLPEIRSDSIGFRCVQ